MVDVQRKILDAVVEHILRQAEKSYQKYVIDKDVEKTFQPGSGVKIKISHKSLLDQQTQLIMTIVESILTSPQLSGLIKSGAVDILKLLEDSRIPLLPGAKEAIEKMLREAMQSAEMGQQLQQQQLEQTQNPNEQDPEKQQGAEPPSDGQPGGLQPGVAPPKPDAPLPPDSNFANPYHSPHDGKFTHAGGGGVAHTLSAVAGYFGLTTGKHVSIAPSGQIKLKKPKTVADAHDMLGAMNKIHDIATHEHSLALKLPENHEHRVKAVMRLAHVQQQHTRAVKMAHAALGAHLAKNAKVEAALKSASGKS